TLPLRDWRPSRIGGSSADRANTRTCWGERYNERAIPWFARSKRKQSRDSFYTRRAPSMFESADLSLQIEDPNLPSLTCNPESAICRPTAQPAPLSYLAFSLSSNHPRAEFATIRPACRAIPGFCGLHCNGRLMETSTRE